MKADELKRLRDALGRLTANQRKLVLHELAHAQAIDEVADCIEKRLAARPMCPACNGEHVVRNGFANGLQRYKCRDCRITFNALTGTPLARLRYRDKWLDQAKVLDEGQSVRKAATRLGVHSTTAFRWRHRWLACPREAKAVHMAGVVEADETYQLLSYKGQPARLARQTQRAPRRRGGKAAKRGVSSEQVPILVMRNRSGETSDFVLPNTGKAALKAVLPQALADDSVLCSDGSNHLHQAAVELAIEHQAINMSAGERIRGPWHVQNVNAYHSRLKTWLRRFNGISTHYLPNYLGWFRALDRNARLRVDAVSLLALAIGPGPSALNAN